ncbi:hypothetical protein UL79_23270, partial [Shigella dysenteriae]
SSGRLLKNTCSTNWKHHQECDGWYIYEKIIDDNFAIVIESLGFALKIYGGDERFRNGSSVVLEDEDYSLIYNFLVNAGCQQVELAEQVDAIVGDASN